MAELVHLVKLCVGVDHVAHLAELLQYRDSHAPKGQHPHVHVTRMFPKRGDELLNGGSLYWVIKGAIQARQSIVGLEEVTGADGIRRCAILLGSELILTQNQPRRPFQGWRYLKVEDAPSDVGPYQEGADDLPEDMRADLVKLGLL